MNAERDCFASCVHIAIVAGGTQAIDFDEKTIEKPHRKFWNFFDSKLLASRSHVPKGFNSGHAVGFSPGA